LKFANLKLNLRGANCFGTQIPRTENWKTRILFSGSKSF